MCYPSGRRKSKIALAWVQTVSATSITLSVQTQPTPADPVLWAIRRTRRQMVRHKSRAKLAPKKNRCKAVGRPYGAWCPFSPLEGRLHVCYCVLFRHPLASLTNNKILTHQWWKLLLMFHLTKYLTKLPVFKQNYYFCAMFWCLALNPAPDRVNISPLLRRRDSSATCRQQSLLMLQMKQAFTG